MRRILPALAAAWLAAAPAFAGTLTLDGPMEQGGLIRGTVDPGAAVSLDGKKLRVAPDGHFIFGFDRDAPAQSALDVVYRDGSKEHRDLAVAARQYDIRRIDNLPPESVSPGPDTLARIKRENALIGAALAANSDSLDFERPVLWPVLGTISGIYGSQSILNGQPRQPHYGVDVAAPAGTPVKAVNAGRVSLAERDFYLTGGTVIIDHGYGLSSIYIHLQKLLVKKGQRVKAGEEIGELGATGRATGPNLHWGMNWESVRLDPELAAGPMPAPNPASGGAARTTAPGADAPGVQPPH